MAHELPELPYAHDALEPHIDGRTMEIHHGKHHAEIEHHDQHHGSRALSKPDTGTTSKEERQGCRAERVVDDPEQVARRLHARGGEQGKVAARRMEQATQRYGFDDEAHDPEDQ